MFCDMIQVADQSAEFWNTRNMITDTVNKFNK